MLSGLQGPLNQKQQAEKNDHIESTIGTNVNLYTDRKNDYDFGGSSEDFEEALRNDEKVMDRINQKAHDTILNQERQSGAPVSNEKPTKESNEQEKGEETVENFLLETNYYWQAGQDEPVEQGSMEWSKRQLRKSYESHLEKLDPTSDDFSEKTKALQQSILQDLQYLEKNGHLG